MVHRARPCQLEVAQGLALRVADGDQRCPGEVAVERRLEVEILAPVERVHGRRPDQTAEGEREIIYVAVDHVEVAGADEDGVELADQIHDHEVAIGRAQTHGARNHRDQRGAVRESPLAKSVTSWPRRTSSSVRWDTTRSVPP